jgi:hypothetical protein
MSICAVSDSKEAVLVTDILSNPFQIVNCKQFALLYLIIFVLIHVLLTIMFAFVQQQNLSVVVMSDASSRATKRAFVQGDCILILQC